MLPPVSTSFVAVFRVGHKAVFIARHVSEAVIFCRLEQAPRSSGSREYSQNWFSVFCRRATKDTRANLGCQLLHRNHENGLNPFGLPELRGACSSLLSRRLKTHRCVPLALPVLNSLQFADSKKHWQSQWHIRILTASESACRRRGTGLVPLRRGCRLERALRPRDRCLQVRPSVFPEPVRLQTDDRIFRSRLKSCLTE